MVSGQNIYLGKAGEEVAVHFLKKNGYRLIFRNFRCKLGEIDLIAYEKDTICFLEVKTRTSSRFGIPGEAVSRSKQRQISKAALVYLKANNLWDKKARFDVVSVVYSKNSPQVSLIKNAFELEKNYVI